VSPSERDTAVVQAGCSNLEDMAEDMAVSRAVGNSAGDRHIGVRHLQVIEDRDIQAGLKQFGQVQANADTTGSVSA